MKKDDLISRAALLKDLSYCAPELWQDEEYIKAKIMKQPTVDAVPVVHARWGEDGECSKCKFQPWYEHDIHTLSYCPNCGARMDGEQHIAFADQSGAEYADNPTV